MTDHQMHLWRLSENSRRAPEPVEFWRANQGLFTGPVNVGHVIPPPPPAEAERTHSLNLATGLQQAAQAELPTEVTLQDSRTTHITTFHTPNIAFQLCYSGEATIQRQKPFHTKLVITFAIPDTSNF